MINYVGIIPKYERSSVSVSADGRIVISGYWDKTVQIWDGTLGECLSTLGGYSGSVRLVSVSADRRHDTSGFWDETSGDMTP